MLRIYIDYPSHFAVINAIREATFSFNSLYGQNNNIYLTGGCIYGAEWDLHIADIDIKYTPECLFKDERFLSILKTKSNICSVGKIKNRITRTGITITSSLINEIEVSMCELTKSFDEYVLTNMSFATAGIINLVTGKNENPYSVITQRDLKNKTLSISSYSVIVDDPSRIGILLSIMALHGIDAGDGLTFPVPEKIYNDCSDAMIQHIMYLGIYKISNYPNTTRDKYEAIKKYIDLLYKAGWWSSIANGLTIKGDFPPLEDVKDKNKNCRDMFAIASFKRFEFRFADIPYLFWFSPRRKTTPEGRYIILMTYICHIISSDTEKYSAAYIKNGSFDCDHTSFKKLIKEWPLSINFIHKFIENYECARTKFSRILYLNITSDILVFDF
jgi:hypothetical protein